jgi:hypothetical protein
MQFIDAKEALKSQRQLPNGEPACFRNLLSVICDLRFVIFKKKLTLPGRRPLGALRELSLIEKFCSEK